MKDRQDCAVALWIEEFVGVPARGEGAGFGFTIADDAGDDQIGVVEGGAV